MVRAEAAFIFVHIKLLMQNLRCAVNHIIGDAKQRLSQFMVFAVPRSKSVAARNAIFWGLVPVERIELPTFGLQNRCSTAELNRHGRTAISAAAPGQGRQMTEAPPGPLTFNFPESY